MLYEVITLFGQIVVNDERVLPAIAEVFPHGAAGIGRDVLHRRRFRGGRRNHDGIGHRPVLLELAYHRGDRRVLLADGHVDAFDAGADLVDDGVERSYNFV